MPFTAAGRDHEAAWNLVPALLIMMEVPHLGQMTEVHDELLVLLEKSLVEGGRLEDADRLGRARSAAAARRQGDFHRLIEEQGRWSELGSHTQSPGGR